MKCLSISQPFAELVVSGAKTIELRSWNTKFRGEFLVHAPLQVRKNDCRRLGINCSSLATGAIVGRVELCGVIKYDSTSQIRTDKERHYASLSMTNISKKRYGFELANSVRFQAPVPCKGKLGFFEVSEPESKPTRNSIISDILNEEHRYGLVGHH